MGVGVCMQSKHRKEREKEEKEEKAAISRTPQPVPPLDDHLIHETQADLGYRPPHLSIVRVT